MKPAQFKTQEPVAWDAHSAFDGMRVPEKSDLSGGWADTTPPQRTWVGLTDAELAEFSDAKLGSYDLCLEVEAKLNEKNT